MTNFIHSMLGFKKLSLAQKTAPNFLLVVLSGTLLLTLPISNKNSQFLNWLDALLTATSATCVTGLSVFMVADQLSWFDQLILFLLIQVGSLGLTTFMAVFILIVKNRLSMNEKIATKETLNQGRVVNMRKFPLDTLYYVLFFEAVGTILISFRMIPRFGLMDGSFRAVFLAVSAFCNAGFDTLGSVSLQEYVHDSLICLIIIALIVLGGPDSAVWFDIRDKVGSLLHHRITFKKFRHSLSLHTKIISSVNLFLIIISGLPIMLVEFTGPKTLGDFNIFEELMTAMSESMALRTADLTTINYAGLKSATDLLMMVVMFIGGSPGSTAGGIKTTTITVLVIYTISSLKRRERTVVLHRKIGRGIIIRAIGIFFINLAVLFTGTFLLNVVEQKPFLSLSFEAVNVMVTVGSSLGIATSPGVGGKLIIIFLMYVGRIGTSTLILSLTRNKPNRNSANKISFPNGNIIVG